jgi:hypothetical protein
VLQIVGATLKQQDAKDQVPPVVLFPTPPTTTAPKEQHPLIELQVLLQLPPPMKPSTALFKFLKPPPFVDRNPLDVLQSPPKIDV